MKKYLMISSLLLPLVAFSASTTYQGSVRNLTGYNFDGIKVELTEKCGEWFCAGWKSKKIPLKADGTWSVRTPRAGSYMLRFYTVSDVTYPLELSASDANKEQALTVLETSPAVIPVYLTDGTDAGPWIENVVAGRELNFFSEINSDIPSKAVLTSNFTLRGSQLKIPAQVYAYFGQKDYAYRMTLTTGKYESSSTTGHLETSGVLGRDIYSSISSLTIDNSQDNPIFSGTYSGQIFTRYLPKHFSGMTGNMEVACHEGKLTGTYSGHYKDPLDYGTLDEKFSSAINGECKPGFTRFSLTAEFPARISGNRPISVVIEFTSDNITGDHVLFTSITSPSTTGFNNEWFKKIH